MNVVAHGLDEMKKEAHRFAATLALKNEGATLVTLQGDLGAGKTTFARAVAGYFGVEENFTSPTFVLEKVYETETGPFKRLIHIDVYRLENPEELEPLRLADDLSNPENLILLEWPERVAGALPKSVINIKFEFIDENTRSISYGE